MRISLKKILMTAALGLVVGCVPGVGGGDAGTGGCESNLDCPDGEQCQLELGVCEVPCTADAECTEEGRTVCNMRPDPDSPYPLDVDGTRDHCICEAGSCPTGETCGDTGLCEPEDVPEGCTEDIDCEDDEVCDTGTGECLCETVGDVRADGTVCQGDGAWVALCDDETCWVDGDLCQRDDTDVEFNLCVLADEVTNDCVAGDDAEAPAGDPIVIYNVETLDDPVAAGCNIGGTDFPLRSYYVELYSEVDLTGITDPQTIFFRPGFDVGNDKFFQDVGATVETSLAEYDDFPDEYNAIVYVCGTPSPADIAVQVRTGGNVSNAYCFDSTAAVP